MPIKSRLVTKGFEEYLERLQKAGRDIDVAVDAVLAAGGQVLANGMHDRVAKDTGNLDEHIGVTEPQRDGNIHFVEVGILNADAETARYGNAQEFGSSSMPAHPYIRPALDEDMPAARAVMRKVFKEALSA